ncbi:MAG TPA: hypothetical protein VNN21_06480 [Dehalococcoidia bacterium]|nr:hypothetical protein [Dehalococcoidia bacterium]
MASEEDLWSDATAEAPDAEARLAHASDESPFRSPRIPLLVAVYSVGLVLFLAVEPTLPWVLLIVTGLVALGTDGILRTHRAAIEQEDAAWTAPLLFLPTLNALAAGLFLEDALDGYWVLPGVAIAAVLMGAILYAQYLAVEPHHPSFAGARFVLNLGTFLTAFAFYAVVYSFDVSLVPAALTVGLVTVLLSVEMLREAETDPIRALVFAGVIGVIVSQARWGLYFLPLESYLAGVFLLLVFYLTSGLVQHHLNDDLRPPVVAEFSLITVLGLVIVALGRIFESS